jgi:plasmid stabilization system protein ParE
MGRTAAQQDKLDAALFATLEYLARKRTRRDLLDVGEQRVTLDITGTVGRSMVNQQFSGRLVVSPDQTAASSSAPDTGHLIAWLLDQFDAADRSQILVALPKEFEELGAMPPIGQAIMADALDLLKRLRSATMQSRRGAVVFALDTE